MDVEIYWGSGSPFAWRVLMAAELKGVDFQSHQLSFTAQEHKAPAYLALNPRGEVPTLKHGDVVLTESIAIMVYLDRLSPEPPLFDGDAARSAAIWRWVSIAAYHLEPLLSRIVGPIFGQSVDRDAEDMQTAARAIHEEWAQMERVLNDQHYLVDNRLSGADIVVYTGMMFLRRIAGRDVTEPLALGLHTLDARYPSLAGWCDRMTETRGYDRAYPPHWRSDSQ